MARVTLVLLFILALLVGTILLEIYLSRRESRWPGLVLPLICFLLSLLYPLNLAAPSGGVSVGFFAQLLAVWLMGSIPTIVLLAVYFAARAKQRRRRQLEKMHIQDLD